MKIIPPHRRTVLLFIGLRSFQPVFCSAAQELIGQKRGRKRWSSVANSITAVQILKIEAVIVQVFDYFSPKYAVIERVLSD